MFYGIARREDKKQAYSIRVGAFGFLHVFSDIYFHSITAGTDGRPFENINMETEKGVPVKWVQEILN